MVDLQPMWNSQRADGPAIILAIGTATPPNVFEQSSYPDYYFRITNSEHMTELKQKFMRICEKSMIKKRHMHLTEKTVKENPNLCSYVAPSLDARQDMAVEEVPRLGKEAAVKAIEEWGQDKSKITHLVFASTNGMDMPGADYQLAKLLGLGHSVQRAMMYNLGCYAGGTVLRVAKDIAENNRGARVLVVCSEVTAASFRCPSDAQLGCLVGHTLFADGAAAVMVGAHPLESSEKPCFEVLWSSQTTLPDCASTIDGHTREVGLVFHLKEELPELISNNIGPALVETLGRFGISDWNELFWVVHPGGPAILDQIEGKLQLDGRKMRASRYVLGEYGNMWSASVLFVLDEMRKWSREKGCRTTGEGLEMGVLFGFGPGVTLETVVLKSVPLLRLTDHLVL